MCKYVMIRFKSNRRIPKEGGYVMNFGELICSSLVIR